MILLVVQNDHIVKRIGNVTYVILVYYIVQHTERCCYVIFLLPPVPFYGPFWAINLKIGKPEWGKRQLRAAVVPPNDVFGRDLAALLKKV